MNTTTFCWVCGSPTTNAETRVCEECANIKHGIDLSNQVFQDQLKLEDIRLKRVETERDEACAENQRLREALEKMLLYFGNPREEEWSNKTSFKEALKVEFEAKQVLKSSTP